MHRYSQTQTVESGRWLLTASQDGLQAVDREPTETENDSACQQLNVVVNSWALPVENSRQEIDDNFNIDQGVSQSVDSWHAAADSYENFQNLLWFWRGFRILCSRGSWLDGYDGFAEDLEGLILL